MWWKTARQPFVTLSTAESELIAVTEGHVAARSVDAFMQEAFSPDPKFISEGVTLQGSDNQAAVQILNRAGATGHISWRTRHLKIRAAEVMEAVDRKRGKLFHVPGKQMAADIGTKTLPAPTLEHLMKLLCMASMVEVTNAMDDDLWDSNHQRFAVSRRYWWDP